MRLGRQGERGIRDRNRPREWIEQGLQDGCITRDMEWGIDLPGGEATESPRGGGEAADSQDLVLYVWVDAPIEYISSTKQYTERVGPDAFDWETAWLEGASDDHPDGGEIVHVIGRDIIQHHTIFWPAMLEATDHAEPRAVMASGFVTLDGKGFSTSRDRAVWADEYLDEGFHPDPLRYYLATNGGFQQDVDFSWEKFAERVNTELVGTVGNFLYRSLLFAHRNFEGGPDADAPSDDVAARIDEAVDDVAAVEGRITRTLDGVAPNAGVRFGASSHLARFLLAAREHEPPLRFATNCKLTPGTERGLERLDAPVAWFDRSAEPEAASTMEWAAGRTFGRDDGSPRAVADRGAVGKEPMIRVVGATPDAVAAVVEHLLGAVDPDGS